MFKLFKRDRHEVATNVVVPVVVPVAVAMDDVLDEPLPRIILDDYDAPYGGPWTDAVTEENIEAAISALLIELGQPDYNAAASLAAIQTPQDRVDLIMNAMNYMMDGCGSDFDKPKAVEVQPCDDEEYDWNADIDDEDEDEDESEEMEATYASVKAFLLERKGVEITLQEYLDANRFSFSV